MKKKRDFYLGARGTCDKCGEYTLDVKYFNENAAHPAEISCSSCKKPSIAGESYELTKILVSRSKKYGQKGITRRKKNE